MKKRSSDAKKIFAFWGASTVVIVATVGLTFGYQNWLDAAAKTNLAIHSNPLQNFTATDMAKAKTISQMVIAKVYALPKFALTDASKHGAVLGAKTPTPLTQEEIADISTPAVVRIFNQTQGTVSMPEFTIDLENFKLVPAGKTYSEQDKTLVTGTGFFVDSQGHLITNAHVIDKHAILDDFTAAALEYYGVQVEDQINGLSQTEMLNLGKKMLAQYGSDPNTAAKMFAIDLLGSIKQYIDQKATVDATQNITVLNSAGEGTKINSLTDVEKLAKQGFTATLVDWKPNYAISHEDVALLKIDHTPTPFLSINPNTKPSTGQQIYVIGFPANAEIDFSDLFNRSMTQGSINSIKKLDDFEIYQTDAKISEGSSGSPMINDKGEVIGIVTLQKSSTQGDSFGYATPIGTAQALMTSNGVNVTNNPYITSFTQGVNLAAQSLCRKANLQFTMASNLDASFNNPSLQKYIDKCKGVIAAGQSQDGTIYQIREYLGKIPLFAWAGGVVFVLISIGAVFIWLRVRKVGSIIQAKPTVMA